MQAKRPRSNNSTTTQMLDLDQIPFIVEDPLRIEDLMASLCEAAEASLPETPSLEALRAQFQAFALSHPEANPLVDYNRLALEDQELEDRAEALANLCRVRETLFAVRAGLDEGHPQKAVSGLAELVSKTESLDHRLHLRGELLTAISELKGAVISELKEWFDRFFVANSTEIHFFAEVTPQTGAPLMFVEYLELVETHESLIQTALEANFNRITDHLKAQLELITTTASLRLLLTYSDTNDDESILSQALPLEGQSELEQYLESLSALLKFVGTIPRVSNALFQPVIHSLNRIVAKHISQIMDRAPASLDRAVNSIRLMWARQIDHLRQTGRYNADVPDLKLVAGGDDDLAYRAIYADVKLGGLLSWVETYLQNLAPEVFVPSALRVVGNDGEQLTPSESVKAAVAKSAARDVPVEANRLHSQATPVAEDEWDNSAWDEDIGFDSVATVVEPLGATNPIDDPEADGWEWNEDLDLDDPAPSLPLTTPPGGSFQVTIVPDALFEALNTFVTEMAETVLPEVTLVAMRDVYSAILMVGELFYPSQLLLFNDLSRLKQLLQEVAVDTESLETHLALLLKEQFRTSFAAPLANLAAIDFDALLSNPGNSAKLETLTRFMHTQLQAETSALLPLNPQVVHTLVCTFINRLHALMIEKVVAMVDISEEESEVLARLVTDCVDHLPVAEALVLYVNKLRMLGYILQSHLKDIMERFYNSDFFEFETAELNGLVKALFMDSDLRQRSIQDIRDIRQAE